MRSQLPGAGELCSQRVLTYLEPSGLLSDVLKPYLQGGTGSRSALLFTAVLIGLDAKDIKVHEVLGKLKEYLEEKDERNETKLAARLRDVASETATLAQFGDAAALLGGELLTGGQLETFLCDGIWRLYRPLVLGCEKPRMPLWNQERSGGNPLQYVPIWRTGGCTVYRFMDYFEAMLLFVWGGSTEEPKLEDFAEP